MLKCDALYILIFYAWIMLLEVFVPSVASEFGFVASDAPPLTIAITNILLALNSIFIGYFWLNGMKDIVYVFFYHLRHKKLIKYQEEAIRAETIPDAKVVMLYCTCNDFEEYALMDCLRQSHSNTKTVILDDSTDPEYICRIDNFAAINQIEVIRRGDRKGFKAGNINNYLKGRKDYNYFVILDSDEIIPYTFVEDCLRYFNYYQNVGIVQANHCATRNSNSFMKMFHVGVNAHWPTYQTMKHHYGFMSLLGHGAMVSRECYEAVNGMPEVVAEDLCFSIEAREAGFFTAFAGNIVCEEEYPVDYLAFKKRHSKWAQGNFEFMRRYAGRIIRSNMTWFEKLDIFLFTYNLPLTALFSFYIVINVILLPVFGHNLHYPAWLLIPTIIFFVAPTINDFIYLIKRERIGRLLRYMLLTFLLYGSLLYQSIKTSCLALLGKKPKFIVTPKTRHDIKLTEAIELNCGEIIFCSSLISISIVFKGSILPVLLIVGPAVMSIYLTRFANVKNRHSSFAGRRQRKCKHASSSEVTVI